MVTFKFENKKVFLTIALFLLLILVGILIWFFNFKKEEPVIQVYEKEGLTEEEKIEILDRMAQAGTTTYSKEEKISVVEELKNTDNSASNEEKINILESLKTKN